MWLTDDEIGELTHRKRHKLQMEALRMMGIEHRVRADGSIAVMRSHVERLFGATAPGTTAAKEYAFGHIKRATPAQH